MESKGIETWQIALFLGVAWVSCFVEFVSAFVCYKIYKEHMLQEYERIPGPFGGGGGAFGGFLV